MRKISMSTISPKKQLCILIILGSIFLCIGLFFSLLPFYNKLTSTSKTTAEVVDIVVEVSNDSDGHSQTYYYPVFIYNANGKNIEVTHRFSPSPYEIGDSFEIFYNPEKPTKYYIEGKDGGNWIMILFGSIFTVVGALILTLTTKFMILPRLRAKSKTPSV